MRFLLFIFTFLLSLNISNYIFAIEIDDITINLNEQNNGEKKLREIFYNESSDCINGKCRTNKNYAKIGIENYSQKDPWRKFYAGIDINWIVERFGGGYEQTMHSHNFWRRFQNLDVYLGVRMFRFFGTEVGYSHFGNVKAKSGYKMNLDGVFISLIGYTPHINIGSISSIEGYASVGCFAVINTSNTQKQIISGKFGVGIIGKVYGSFAVNIGVDYYYPNNNFSKAGFLAFKTGFNIYLSI